MYIYVHIYICAFIHAYICIYAFLYMNVGDLSRACNQTQDILLPHSLFFALLLCFVSELF